MSSDLGNSSNNTSNNSLLNLFQDSENVTPSPTASPFEFGPLPPSPFNPHPPAMEMIMEVTETGTTSSENASSPRTEIHILEDDLNLKPDKLEPNKTSDEVKKGFPCQCGGKSRDDNRVDICKKIQEVNDEEKKIKEYKSIIKQRKEDLKTFVDRHIGDKEVVRRYIEEDEIFRKYVENKKLFQAEEEDLCDCPAHVHDKEHPLELFEVS